MPANLTWDPAVFGYTMESGDDLTFDERDSAPFVPKCVVVDPDFRLAGRADRHAASPGTGRSSMRPMCKRLHQASIRKSPEKLRGTYAGLGAKDVIDYIRSLGVTSVELLPIHTFVNDSHLLEQGLTNYWGYNTIGFFAPDPRYAVRRAQQPARVQGDGGAVPRGRARGHSRRRLQPHRRRQ